jgi:hypothetical protein
MAPLSRQLGPFSAIPIQRGMVQSQSIALCFKKKSFSVEIVFCLEPASREWTPLPPRNHITGGGGSERAISIMLPYSVKIITNSVDFIGGSERHFVCTISRSVGSRRVKMKFHPRGRARQGLVQARGRRLRRLYQSVCREVVINVIKSLRCTRYRAPVHLSSVCFAGQKLQMDQVISFSLSRIRQ